MANPLKFYKDKITPYPQYVLTLAILDCQVMVLQNTSSQPKVGFEIDAKMTQKWEFIEACKVNWDVYQPLKQHKQDICRGGCGWSKVIRFKVITSFKASR